MVGIGGTKTYLWGQFNCYEAVVCISMILEKT